MGERLEPQDGLQTYFEPLRTESQSYQFPKRLMPLREFPPLGSFLPSFRLTLVSSKTKFLPTFIIRHFTGIATTGKWATAVFGLPIFLNSFSVRTTADSGFRLSPLSKRPKPRVIRLSFSVAETCDQRQPVPLNPIKTTTPKPGVIALMTLMLAG